MADEAPAQGTPDTGGADAPAAAETTGEMSTLDVIRQIRGGSQAELEARAGEQSDTESEGGEPEAEAPAEETSQEVDSEEDKPSDESEQLDTSDLDYDERIAAATEALEAEDYDKALRLVFGDKLTLEKLAAKMQVHPKRFEALRKQKRKQEEEFAKQDQSFKARAQQLAQELLPSRQFQLATQEYQQQGDTSAVVQAFEHATGEPFKDFLRKYAANEKSPPAHKAPANDEIAALRKEIEALKQGGPKPERDPAEVQREQTQLFHEHLATELEGHKVTSLPGWQRKVTRELQKHYDANLKGSRISSKVAAKRVLERTIAEAEALGLTRKEAEEKVQGKPKQKPTTLKRSGATETGADTPTGTTDEERQAAFFKWRRQRQLKETK